MIPELRVWLLWWVWAVALNATGVLLYVFADGERETVEVWLEVSPTSVPPTDTVREVTVSAKLSRAISAPVELSLVLSGATLDGKELSLTVAGGETVGAARFAAPSLPQGGKPDVVTVAVKGPTGSVPGRFRVLVRTSRLTVEILPPGVGTTPLPDAWIEISPTAIDAATARAVTLTGFLSVRQPTATPLAVQLDGLDGGMKEYTLTIPANADKESLLAVPVPALPPGGTPLTITGRLVADPAIPARYKLVPARAVATATAVPPPLKPDPVVPVWLEVTPKELAADAKDRTVTVTVRTDPDPDKKRKAALAVAVTLNRGDLAEGSGFSYADPERKAFVIPAGMAEVSVPLTVPPPTVAGADKKLVAELVADTAAPKRYEFDLQKPKSATVDVRAPKPEYKIELTVLREAKDGEQLVTVIATVNGGKPVPGGKLPFTVVGEKVKEKEDYVLDEPANALPITDGKGRLRLRLPHNPDLPPAGTVSVRFEPVPDFKFAATKDTKPDAPSEVVIDTKPDYTKRKLLLLVVASDLLFKPDGSTTKEGEAFATALKPVLEKHREALVGGGLYLIPCPTEKLAGDAEYPAKMQAGWRGRGWTGRDAPLRVPVDDKDRFQLATKAYNLYEPCQAFLLARQGVVARLAEASGPADPFTLVVWPSRDAPSDFKKGGGLLIADESKDAMAKASGRIELGWLGNGTAPAVKELTAELGKNNGFDGAKNLVWSDGLGKAADAVADRVSKLIGNPK